MAYCRYAEFSLLTRLFGRFPLPLPFFAVSCPNAHFQTFGHEPFHIQDRQSLPVSSGPFEEYAAAAPSLDRSF